MLRYYYFPPEILIEILKRLPVKSIFRFTVVSKSWHALITNPSRPSFISTHLHHTLSNIANENSKGNLTILVTSGKSKCCIFPVCENEREEVDFSGFPTLELNFPLDGWFKIVGSTNGLLCLASELGVKKVIFWNPSIRRSLVLPLPTRKYIYGDTIVFGFGVDLRDGDFKVLRIVYSGANLLELPEAEVYSLNRRAWKRVMPPDYRYELIDFSKSQVFVNGRSHWLAYRDFEKLILAFDMSDEVFSEIMVPDALFRGSRVTLCCNFSAESLTLIKCRQGTNNVMSYCIWMMKEYGVVESWTRMYSFDLVGGMERVGGVWRDGKVLVAKWFNELVLYDIKTSTIKAIGKFESSPWFYVDRYVESLVLLTE